MDRAIQAQTIEPARSHELGGEHHPAELANERLKRSFALWLWGGLLLSVAVPFAVVTVRSGRARPGGGGARRGSGGPEGSRNRGCARRDREDGVPEPRLRPPLDEVFTAGNPVLATILLRPNPIREGVCRYPGVEELEVTRTNRDELSDRLARRLAGR